MSKNNKRQPGTLAVWGGEEDKNFWQHATQVPVVHSVAYGYPDADEWQAVALGQQPGHIYGRNTNPTVAVFEEKVRLLEQAEAATSFATGMAAISNTLYTLLKPGDRVISVRDTYGGTSKLFMEFLPRLNITATLCPTTDHDSLEAEIANGCQVVYLETATNPTVKVVDIERLARAAHQVGALVVVDNTFATPINCTPLLLGADLVLHSATKYLGGHADALGGVVCGRQELIDALLVASFTGDPGVIQTLLGQGANINARSPESRTPLMIASEGGKLDAVRLLLQSQANPYAVDKKQATAAVLAEASGHAEVKELILNPDQWGQSEASVRISEEMEMARNALAGNAAVEETIAPNKLAEPVGQGAENAPRAESQRIREASRDKPVVALNGSKISSTNPKVAPVKTLVLAAYREEPLPVVVENVDGDTATVRMMNAESGNGYQVVAGSTIPGTNYEVKEVTRKFVSSKEGKGRMVDVSRVEIQDKTSGNSHLLVKDVSGQTADSYAILTSADSKYRYVVKAGDVFRTATADFGETDYQVLDIRPSGVVIKNLETEEVTTVAREGVVAP